MQIESLRFFSQKMIMSPNIFLGGIEIKLEVLRIYFVFSGISNYELNRILASI